MKRFCVYYYGWYYVPKKIRIGADTKEEAIDLFKNLGLDYEKINKVVEIKE